MMLLKYFQLD